MTKFVKLTLDICFPVWIIDAAMIKSLNYNFKCPNDIILWNLNAPSLLLNSLQTIQKGRKKRSLYSFFGVFENENIKGIFNSIKFYVCEPAMIRTIMKVLRKRNKSKEIILKLIEGYKWTRLLRTYASTNLKITSEILLLIEIKDFNSSQKFFSVKIAAF